MDINILGEKYTLIIATEKDEPRLKDIGGFCDDSSKKCVVKDICNEISTPFDKENLAYQQREIIRHEIVHAFLCESGLADNCEWAVNEEVVDWIAMQGLKIYKAWQEAGAVNE